MTDSSSQASEREFGEIEIKENRVFGLTLLIVEVGLCFVYGYKLRYTTNTVSSVDHLLVTMLALLVLGKQSVM